MILINRSLAHVGTVALKAFQGLKDSSRDFQPNCAISFFRLHLMLHACAARFDMTFWVENF